MQSLRGERDPVQIDLRELIDKGANKAPTPAPLMARASTLSAATTTPATSMATPSVADGSAASGEANIYVVGNTGKDTEDALYKMNR